MPWASVREDWIDHRNSFRRGQITSRIRAINEYRPRIELGKRAEMDDLVEFIARGAVLNEGGIQQALLELRDAMLFFALRGQSVKLPGLGTFTPTIDLDGNLSISHRADMYVKQHLNIPGEFRGDIENRDSIGKTGDEVGRGAPGRPGRIAARRDCFSVPDQIILDQAVSWNGYVSSWRRGCCVGCPLAGLDSVYAPASREQGVFLSGTNLARCRTCF